MREVDPDLFMHIALLLSGVLIHGLVPDDMSVSTANSIRKGKDANLTEWASYRGIALSSIVSKTIDLIVQSRYKHLLATSDLQFGFNKKRSTVMCSMIFLETSARYVSNSSEAYCTLLHATN